MVGGWSVQQVSRREADSMKVEPFEHHGDEHSVHVYNTTNDILLFLRALPPHLDAKSPSIPCFKLFNPCHKYKGKRTLTPPCCAWIHTISWCNDDVCTFFRIGKYTKQQRAHEASHTMDAPNILRQAELALHPALVSGRWCFNGSTP